MSLSYTAAVHESSRHQLLREFARAARIISRMNQTVPPSFDNMARHWYLTGYVEAAASPTLKACLETAWGF